MDELLTEGQLRKYWQRQASLSTWTDSGYNSSNATTDDAADITAATKLSAGTSSNGVTEHKQRKKWVMNAFAMTAPGHLAPGEYHSALSLKQIHHHLHDIRVVETSQSRTSNTRPLGTTCEDVRRSRLSRHLFCRCARYLRCLSKQQWTRLEGCCTGSGA